MCKNLKETIAMIDKSKRLKAQVSETDAMLFNGIAKDMAEMDKKIDEGFTESKKEQCVMNGKLDVVIARQNAGIDEDRLYGAVGKLLFTTWTGRFILVLVFSSIALAGQRIFELLKGVPLQ